MRPQELEAVIAKGLDIFDGDTGECYCVPANGDTIKELIRNLAEVGHTMSDIEVHPSSEALTEIDEFIGFRPSIAIRLEANREEE